MDTSETYLRMCEKATEIQQIENCYTRWELASRPDGIHHYIYSTNDAFADLYYVEHLKQEGTVNLIKIVWLPRQDQLWEMLGGNATDWLHELWDFSQESDQVEWDSREQLLLSFVMKEKFGKYWSGTDWVK